MSDMRTLFGLEADMKRDVFSIPAVRERNHSTASLLLRAVIILFVGTYTSPLTKYMHSPTTRIQGIPNALK